MSFLKALTAISLVASFVCTGLPALSPDRTAEDVTSKCSFAVSSNADKKPLLRDGKHSTAWASSEGESAYVQIALPEDEDVQGVYIMWNAVPEDWQLLESAGGSVWGVVETGYRKNFINAYVPLDGKASKLRIESDSVKWKMAIAEIKVFAQGELPASVQVWQPSPQKADIMVIPAHPDDEYIYFGGTLPYYAGELKKRTVVVYMTSSPMIRKFEALDGLWKTGVREYPVFLPLANKYSSTVEDAEIAWDGLDNAVSLLVEQMRRFRPDVVVTHDLNGEYGHGAHKLTALAAQMAVDAGGDEELYPDSAEKYGIWQVKKCYLHLYSKNKIEMNWEEPLRAFGGKTALDMAKAGYEQHVSQHFRDRPIEDSGKYDSAAFGLYYSSVGKDSGIGDFFENIMDPVPSPSPAKPTAASPSRSPLPAPTKTQDADAAVPAFAGGDSIPTFSGTISPADAKWPAAAVIAAILLAAAAAFSIHNRNVMMKARHAKRG